MNFEEFQNQSRLYVIGALEPEEVEEFEQERTKLGKKAEDFVTQCYALHEAFALSLRSLKASAAIKERLMSMMRERKQRIRSDGDRLTIERSRMQKSASSGVLTPGRDRSNVLPLAGEIDLHMSPIVKASLNVMIAKKPKQLVVDLSGVSYIDSAGLGAVIEAMQEVEAYGGKFALAGLQKTVRSIFKMSRLDQIFSIFPDVDAALAAA
jgi:anti-sigma B factor antagonist